MLPLHLYIQSFHLGNLLDVSLEMRRRWRVKRTKQIITDLSKKFLTFIKNLVNVGKRNNLVKKLCNLTKRIKN